MNTYDAMILKLDRQTVILKEILNLQRQRLQNNKCNSPSIIMYEESKNINYYISPESYWSGLINYANRFLVICTAERNYNNFSVVGSWDNWTNTYPLILMTDIGWVILLNEMPILLGKHHYKFKNGNIWINPDEGDLREKDMKGNWNNVIFVHE
jgi:hypothetical protein